MGEMHCYFYHASLKQGAEPVSVCGTFSTDDKSKVFNIESVMDFIGAGHGAGSRCVMVHSLSYLGEWEDTGE